MVSQATTCHFLYHFFDVHQLGTPVLLHGVADAEHIPVPVIGSRESPHCLATRKAKEFSKLVNGGFSSNIAREFQKRRVY